MKVDVKIYGSGFTEWTASNLKNVSMKSGETELELNNFTVGDALNLYEKLILNSNWQIIDGEIGSSFVVARNHMFYTPNDSIIKKISSIKAKNCVKEQNLIRQKFNKKDPLELYDDSLSLFVDLGITENIDAGTLIEYVKENSQVGEDESVYDILLGNGTKKVSENHFAVSRYNLIYHEIAVENNTFNTVTYDYENIIGVDQNEIVTILPFISERDLTSSKILQKKVNPIVDQTSLDSHLLNIKTWFGNKNKVRSIEFLSNELLNELRWCYQGKIFIKYNPKIKAGDTVTLLDDVTSTYGKFSIDSFEHILDQRGLITILNVKACMDIVDPALDMYHKKISLDMSYELTKMMETKVKTDSEILAIKNIISYYNKISLQQYRYGRFYHMEESSWFDNSGQFPQVDESAYAPALAIRFIPFMKKGKLQIPESIKSGFYHSVEDPFTSIWQKIGDNISDTISKILNNTTTWGESVLRYSLDFLASIPTFGLHELIKVGWNIPQKKAANGERGLSKIDDEEIDILVKNTDYTSWASDENYDLTIGFFNVMAQRKSNLFPGITNDKINVDFKLLKKALNEKALVIKRIINEKFDICGCVEMYDSFSFDSENDSYKINDFIAECKPQGFSNEIGNLHINTYGTEKGVLFYKDSMFSKTNDSKINFTQKTCSFKDTYGDSGRNYIETEIDISYLNYLNEDSLPINKILFVWFHNIFGSNDLQIKSRLDNIEFLLQKYSKLTKEKDDVGVIIMGDFNLEVVNPDSLPRGKDNLVFKLKKDGHNGFKNYMIKPTTLNKAGKVEASIYDNVLLSSNLSINKEFIDVSRFMYPYSDKTQISDHVPVFVGLKKRS